MVLGPAGAGAPAGQHPAPSRWYRQMSLLIAMPQTLSGEPVVLPDGHR